MARLTDEEIYAHEPSFNTETMEGDDGSPCIYCTTKKRKEELESGVWVDLTTFYSYDELIDFICDYFEEDGADIIFEECVNIPNILYDAAFDDTQFDQIKDWYDMDCDRQDAFLAYIEEINSTGTKRDFEDAYVGKYDSTEDFAQEIIEECGYLPKDMPDWLKYCIDYEKVWREIGGDYEECDGYIFRIY